MIGKTIEKKDYSVHVRMTESQYKAMSKMAVDEDVGKNVFIERAIHHYMGHIQEEDFYNEHKK